MKGEGVWVIFIFQVNDAVIERRGSRVTVYWFIIPDSGRDDLSLQKRDTRVWNKDSVRDKIESVKQQHNRPRSSSSQVHLGRVGGRITCCLFRQPGRVGWWVEPDVQPPSCGGLGLNCKIEDRVLKKAKSRKNPKK